MPLPASARPAAPAEARPADRGPAGRWRRAGPAVAAILWLTAAGWGLGAYPLIEPDEGRNGTAAFEVARAGRWLLPTYDGVEFVDKPLLWFDAAALGVRAFGAGELAVRLPSLVFSAATVLLVAWFARRLYGPGAAWIAAVALATSPLVLAYARIAIFDPMASFFMVLALVLFHQAIEDGGGSEGRAPERSAALAWAAMALGALTKGPVAVAVPLMVALPYALWRRRARALWSWPGAAAFLLLVASWLAYVDFRVPGFLDYALRTETGSRLGLAEPGSVDLGSSGPIRSLVPILIVGSLPWSPVAAWGWLPRRKRRPAGTGAADSGRSIAFLALWLIVPTLFFSLAQPKRPHYVLPMVPAIALLLAAAAARKTVTPGALRAGAVSLMPVGGSLLAAATGAWPVLEQLPESLAPSARTMAWVLGLLLLLAPAAGAWLARRRPAAAVLALAAPLLLLPPVASRFMVEGAEFRSSSSLARAIADGCPGAPVVGIDALPTSLPFYLGRPIGLASSTGVPFPSHYVEAHWQEITARGGGGTLFTRSWWNELPARVVVVLERSNQAKSFGAQLQGFEPLTSDRRHTAWGRGC